MAGLDHDAAGNITDLQRRDGLRSIINRYFDATRQAEFLYECVQKTVLETLPEEVSYLEHHSRMRQFIEEHFDMPDKEIENLIGFLHQNDGTLSKRARRNEFNALTNDEVDMLEEKYREIFGR